MLAILLEVAEIVEDIDCTCQKTETKEGKRYLEQSFGFLQVKGKKTREGI
jgi:hypothetical protein